MHADSVSGVLHIDGIGEIHLLSGELVAASTVDHEGPPAVMSILSRRRGTFSFTRCSPPAKPPVAPLMNLILESAKLDDEWGRIADMVVELSQPERIPEGDACLAGLVPWMDGRRTLKEVAHLAGGSTKEIIRSVRAALTSAALAKVARPVATTEGEGEGEGEGEDEADFDQLVDGARARIRAGDLKGAQRQLHLALDRRPSDRIARQNLRRVVALTSKRTREIDQQPRKKIP